MTNKPVMNAPAGEEFKKQLPTEGMVNAKCYAVIDLGSQENEWKWVKKLQRQIQVSFETDQMWEFGDKGTFPLSVHKTYSFFITDSSNLTKDLTSWLDNFVNTKEQPFNVFDLVGKSAELMVLHHTSKAGKLSAKIMAIKPWKKEWELINPEVMLSLDSFNEDEFLKLPEWLREKIQKTQEYAKIINPEEPLVKKTVEELAKDTTDPSDDLPF